MKSKLLKLAKMLLKFKMIDSDKGTLIIDGDLAIGLEVSIEDENGNVMPAPDGEYVIENQKVAIKDGKIESIEPIEEEPETEEVKEEVEVEEMAETVEEPTEEPEKEQPDEKDLRIAELEGLLKDRDAIIENLTAKIKELEEKLNKPVEEPVKMSAVAKEKTSANPALKYFEK